MNWYYMYSAKTVTQINCVVENKLRNRVIHVVLEADGESIIQVCETLETAAKVAATLNDFWGLDKSLTK